MEKSGETEKKEEDSEGQVGEGERGDHVQKTIPGHSPIASK